MSNPNGNKPAMPSTAEGKDGVFVYLGLTKREYFAAMAMQGLLASQKYADFRVVASNALLYADTLLGELEK